MTNIVNFPNEGSRNDYFGVCPICQRQNGMLNDGPDHWFVCNTHKTKWRVGSNLFSGWQHLTDEQLFGQRDKLTRYRAVKEFHPMKPAPTAQEQATTTNPELNDDLSDLPF
jgi:hypothetical protein